MNEQVTLFLSMVSRKIRQLEKRGVHVIYLITSVKQTSSNGTHCFNIIEFDVIPPYLKLPFCHIKNGRGKGKIQNTVNPETVPKEIFYFVYGHLILCTNETIFNLTIKLMAMYLLFVSVGSLLISNQNVVTLSQFEWLIIIDWVTSACRFNLLHLCYSLTVTFLKLFAEGLLFTRILSNSVSRGKWFTFIRHLYF